MEVNFLNQKPCIPSFPGVFQFNTFLVSFWVNRYVFPLSSLLRALLILLSYCLSIRPFRNVFRLPYFSPKSFDFLCIRLLVCFRVISSQLLVEFSFVALEFPVLSVFFYPLSISLIFLSSTVFSGLFLLVVLFVCFFLCFLFLFVPTYSSVFPFFIILTCFRWFFLSAFPVKFPILVLIFVLVLFEGIPIFSQTNFALYRLVHLIRLYHYPLMYKVVLDLFYSFPSNCSPFYVS